MPSYTNLDGTVPDQGIGALFKWQVSDRLAGRRRRNEQVPFVTPHRVNDGTALLETSPHLTWIGHATFVQRLGGQLLATDPIWSKRIHTIPRLSPPGVAFGAVPKLDVVTVSHAHYDHLDLPTLEQVAAPIITGLGHGPIFRGTKLSSTELGWWSSTTIGEVTIHYVPSQHWSRRGLADANDMLWGGFIIEGSSARLYHSGDTAYFDGFTEIGRRYPGIDAAMLPIGAYDPEWFMGKQHMNPEEAVQAFADLGARNFLAMH